MTEMAGVRERLERALVASRSSIVAIAEALALMDSEPSARIFTREDLEKAFTVVIRATNREPDLHPSFVGQLQIAMEAMGLHLVISPPLECVEAYKRDAGIPTESEESKDG